MDRTVSGLDRLQAAIGRPYRLEGEIGAGGMATVYAAEDTRHGRRVAVKVLQDSLASTLGPERFLREIAIAARLQHPHIVGLLDSGAAGGFLYYVMPLVEGVSLRARVAREQELPVEDGLRILREVLDALAYAHAQGVVHRDVKPENILLAGYVPGSGARCHALVTDFGVAKAINDAAPMVATQTGVAIGTPAYMSPEQAAGQPQVDRRSDIYAVGVLAYELLAGVPPFSGVSAAQVMAAHMTRTPEPLTRHRPAVPREIEAVIMRALEKKPADRWQTAEEMLARLEAAATPSQGFPAGRTTQADPVERSFRLSDSICRRLDRRTLDAAIVGSDMRFLDNQVPSRVLVYCLHGTGQDHTAFRALLGQLPYRAIAPTLVGFEPVRRYRPTLTLANHLILLRELLRATIDEVKPGMVVVVGFSSGGDLALQMTADDPDLPPIDGVISLGCNLSLETCFVTRVFRQLGAADESALLEGLRLFGNSCGTLEEWLKVHDYLVGTLRKFGHEIEPVRQFSDEIVAPFEQDADAFANRYRRAAARVPVVRCIWEEAPSTIGILQQLRWRNLDEPSLLGDRCDADSLIVQPGADHFDLKEAAILRPHLEAVIEAAGRQP